MSAPAPPHLADLREAWQMLWRPLGAGDPRVRPGARPAEGPDPYGNPDPEWLRIDWREHLGSADVDGTRVNYAAMGDPEAPALVLVHGLSGCWQNWLETIPRFSRTHRVIALDLPGFGHSPMPRWEISIPAYGQLLRDFCESLGVATTAVAGNSMGGLIAAEAASAAPGFAERLILVAPAGISHAKLRPEAAALAGRIALGLAPLSLSFQARGLSRPKLRRAAFGTVYHDPLGLRRELLCEQLINGSGRPGFLPSLTAVAGYDFAERLAEIDVPALIVWGHDDQIIPAEDAAALRTSQTVILGDTGHMPQLERPVRFNRLLAAFLNRA